MARQKAVFEAWKRREQLTWRRDVVQSETEQMAALEAAFAEREATRQRDISDAVARVEALKTQLLQVFIPVAMLLLLLHMSCWYHIVAHLSPWWMHSSCLGT
jgi:hypothetical protein